MKKTGKYRAKFVIESVENLRDSLQQLGSNLLVRVGKPEEEIFKLARKYKSSWVFCNRERTQEEVEVQDALEKNLWSVGQEVRYSRGKMLYYTSDLPFPITHTPDVFTQFRKEVERGVRIREPLSTPSTLPEFDTGIEVGEIPNIQDFGLEEFKTDDRAVLHFRGGESAALERLNYYFNDSGLPSSYFDTRDGMIGGDYSSKFSPWLSQGCLSPKMIMRALKSYEQRFRPNKSTNWFFSELLWRDFYRLMAKKHGENIFLKGGMQEKENESLTNDITLFNIWRKGRTGVPFIDANMREIAKTGFMSNRGRQNVASFLVNDLQVNWQYGAEYFESMLVDYDAASNWGNWNYLAGVGNDPREIRIFNIMSQARKYDPQGEYVKLWLPELGNLPPTKVHAPEMLTEEEQKEMHFLIGADYPKAMVSFGT